MTVKTVIFVLLFTETSFIYPIFVHVLFRVLYPEKRMKRESGESPGQSRCCEVPFRPTRSVATGAAPGRPSDGNESEDLPVRFAFRSFVG